MRTEKAELYSLELHYGVSSRKKETMLNTNFAATNFQDQSHTMRCPTYSISRCRPYTKTIAVSNTKKEKQNKRFGSVNWLAEIPSKHRSQFVMWPSSGEHKNEHVYNYSFVHRCGGCTRSRSQFAVAAIVVFLVFFSCAPFYVLSNG